MTTRSITVDQFLAHEPSRVWQALTDPALVARWWADGDIAPTVGHEFLLDMGGWGKMPCKVLEVEPDEKLVYTFGEWTLTWRLVPEGAGTRLFLEHDGFDPDRPDHNFAFENMGPGWRDEVLPRLAATLDGQPSRSAP
jgi:uncharacterized protein YndB with AHSA1/START domain